MSMRAFDDADQAVSIAAIIFFIRAAFEGVQQLGALFNGSYNIIALLMIAGYVAAGAGLLKAQKWAWPLGVGVAALSVVFSLMGFPYTILRLLFDAFLLYLLFRPAVRERFGAQAKR